MMPGTRDRGIGGLSAVSAVIGGNLGDELDHTCELGKGECDVPALVHVKGVKGEYAKGIPELFATSRGRIRQMEVARALNWDSRTLSSKMEMNRFRLPSSI
jgi:hypothetical protein